MPAVATPNPFDSHSSPTLQTLQARRLRQLVLLLIGSLALFALINLTVMSETIILALMIGAAVLAGALWLEHKQRTRHALLLVLWTMTLLVTFFVWMRAGVGDPVVLAYPGILLLASMTVTPRPLFALGGTMLVSFALLIWGETAGWYLPKDPGPGVQSFVNQMLILGVIALVARTLANDLHKAVTRAEIDRERARDSAARLAFLVQHDALTGLPNRLLVQDRFSQAAARARRDCDSLTMLVIDLDDFRRINDSLGHGVGDIVLRRMTERLQAVVGETSTLGRIGGDEFVVVSCELGNLDALAVFAQRLLDSLSDPFEHEGLRITCGGSIGISRLPHDGDSFESLLNRAEAALARAKAEGRNAFRFADPEIDSDLGKHLRLVSELRADIERGGLELRYQPIVDLVDGRVGSVEALVRWHHPQHGPVPPTTFIALAERSGLIHALGAWVLREAAAQVRRWEMDGLPPLSVSVNVSPLQLAQDGLEDVIRGVLAATGLPADRLILELTESSLVGDAESLRARVDRLRALGVGLSIDDFGTGYSNLGYLQRFDVQALKIDQRFVRGLADGPQGEAIVRAIAQLAVGLGVRCVAEGIESEREVLRLRALGCHAGQGFRWSDALPAKEFVGWFFEWQAAGR